MEEKKKDNTWGILIVFFIILVIIVGITYFLSSKNKMNESDIKNEVENTRDKVVDDAKDIEENGYIGSYQGTYKVDDSTSYIELKLDKNDSAKIGLDDEVISGKYELKDGSIIVSKDQDTYEFMINSDKSLSYTIDNNTIILRKVSDESLNIIK